MKRQQKQAACGGNISVASHRFTNGWTGDVDLADGIFSEDLRANGVVVGTRALRPGSDFGR
jgi:hypothetical protein